MEIIKMEIIQGTYGKPKRKIKQAWCYQERETAKPWAFHLFAQRNGFAEPRIQVTIFHEDMFNGRDDSIFNIKIPSPGAFACVVSNVLETYRIEVTDDDIMQLHHFWLDLINLW